MDIKELKHKIETNSPITFPLILKYTDSRFISLDYANAICRNNNFEKCFISSISEIDADDVFGTNDSTLFIYVRDILEEFINPEIKNLIVICKEIKVDQKIDYVDMGAKLLPWQIQDWVAMRLPGLTKEEITWLYDVTTISATVEGKYYPDLHIYKLNQECKKLEIFPKSTQQIMFEELNRDNGYSDLTSRTIFDFTKAITEKDNLMLAGILSDLETVDVEGTGAVTLLLRNFKQLLEVSCYNAWKPGMICKSDKQFYYLKSHLKFTQNQLINIYDFLTGVDARIKNGELTLKDSANHLTVNNMLVDYLTCNLIMLGNC